MRNIIRVAIADLGVGKKTDQLFTVVGSCIAIMLYDKVKQIGGMIHIMLGYSKGRKDNACKYADSGIPILLQDMIKSGANRNRLLGAKIAGGAMLLAKTDEHNIAKENLQATHMVLQNHGIQVIASDCGGNFSRRITFDITAGRVEIASHSGYKKIL